MTRHAVNQSTGHSVSVEKMCVRPTECSTDHIGCMNTHPNVKVWYSHHPSTYHGVILPCNSMHDSVHDKATFWLARLFGRTCSCDSFLCHQWFQSWNFAPVASLQHEATTPCKSEFTRIVSRCCHGVVVITSA